jgi:hypothetical protein
MRECRRAIAAFPIYLRRCSEAKMAFQVVGQFDVFAICPAADR